MSNVPRLSIADLGLSVSREIHHIHTQTLISARICLDFQCRIHINDIVAGRGIKCDMWNERTIEMFVCLLCDVKK